MARAQSCGVVEIWPETLYLLCDAIAAFPEPMRDAFPGLGPDASAPEWVLHSHCFLVLAAGRTILVDTGIGPLDGPAGTWLGMAGRLPELLTEVGLRGDAVTTVVLTHLHLDHIGWNVDASGAPRFASADHVVQRAELQHVDRGGSTYRALVDPVVQAGQLRDVEGSQPLGAGLELITTPGHSAGHQSLVVSSGNRRALLAGDAFVHPLQVDDPDLGYRYETDNSVAAATRRRVLSSHPRPATMLLAAHFR